MIDRLEATHMNDPEMTAGILRGWSGALTGNAGLLRLIARDLADGHGSTEDTVKELGEVAAALSNAAATIDRLFPKED